MNLILFILIVNDCKPIKPYPFGIFICNKNKTKKELQDTNSIETNLNKKSKTFTKKITSTKKLKKVI